MLRPADHLAFAIADGPPEAVVIVVQSSTLGKPWRSVRDTTIGHQFKKAQLKQHWRFGKPLPSDGMVLVNDEPLAVTAANTSAHHIDTIED